MVSTVQHPTEDKSEARRAEERAKSLHFLINRSVPKFPKIELKPPENPKIGKYLIYEHL